MRAKVERISTSDELGMVDLHLSGGEINQVTVPSSFVEEHSVVTGGFYVFENGEASFEPEAKPEPAPSTEGTSQLEPPAPEEPAAPTLSSVEETKTTADGPEPAPQS